MQFGELVILLMIFMFMLLVLTAIFTKVKISRSQRIVEQETLDELQGEDEKPEKMDELEKILEYKNSLKPEVETESEIVESSETSLGETVEDVIIAEDRPETEIVMDKVLSDSDFEETIELPTPTEDFKLNDDYIEEPVNPPEIFQPPPDGILDEPLVIDSEPGKKPVIDDESEILEFDYEKEPEPEISVEPVRFADLILDPIRNADKEDSTTVDEIIETPVLDETPEEQAPVEPEMTCMEDESTADEEMEPLEVEPDSPAPETVEEQVVDDVEVEEIYQTETSVVGNDVDLSVELPEPSPEVEALMLSEEEQKEFEKEEERLFKERFLDTEDSKFIGAVTCPHCNEQVPSSLYCLNCGKPLNQRK